MRYACCDRSNLSPAYRVSSVSIQSAMKIQPNRTKRPLRHSLLFFSILFFFSFFLSITRSSDVLALFERSVRFRVAIENNFQPRRKFKYIARSIPFGIRSELIFFLEEKTRKHEARCSRNAHSDLPLPLQFGYFGDRSDLRFFETFSLIDSCYVDPITSEPTTKRFRHKARSSVVVLTLFASIYFYIYISTRRCLATLERLFCFT